MTWVEHALVLVLAVATKDLTKLLSPVSDSMYLTYTLAEGDIASLSIHAVNANNNAFASEVFDRA